MESIIKSPVDIIQELLAILATRKEAAGKLLPIIDDADLRAALENSVDQSNSFIQALMEELSQSGDAVQGETDRENEYQTLWKNAFRQIDNMTGETAQATVDSMEQALRQQYDLFQGQQDLPDSLRQTLAEQRNAL